MTINIEWTWGSASSVTTSGVRISSDCEKCHAEPAVRIIEARGRNGVVSARLGAACFERWQQWREEFVRRGGRA